MTPGTTTLLSVSLVLAASAGLGAAESRGGRALSDESRGGRALSDESRGGRALSGESRGGRAALSDETYRAVPLDQKPPAEVSEKIRAELRPQAVRVEEGDEPFADVWLRKDVPTREPVPTLGVDYGQLPEGSLLGVVRFHGRTKDFRGNRFPAGVYTFRSALQPQDGDHLGVSETRDFVLLAPVSEDRETAPIPHKELNQLSAKVTGTKHPSVLYLTKVFGKAEKLPKVVEDRGRELWILDCEIPAKGGGEGEKKAVRLGIVLVGRAPETF